MGGPVIDLQALVSFDYIWMGAIPFLEARLQRGQKDFHLVFVYRHSRHELQDYHHSQNYFARRSALRIHLARLIVPFGNLT